MEPRWLVFVIVATLFQPALHLSVKNNIYAKRLNNVRNFRFNKDSSAYKYKIKTFEVPVDHFSFSLTDTFNIRYLINDTWYQENDAPIFFYTGNEGSIEVFAENTGFMWEIAPEYGALLVFAEHRYYGESLPYGNKSFTNPQHFGYLTSQQAIADYVDLVEYLKSQEKMKRSPVIVFGGSYGGMLSAWMRMKYPHIVQGAIAASAPILQFTDVTDCKVFAQIVTSNFRVAGAQCASLIRKSWEAITNITADDKGKEWLSNNWTLCQPLKNESHVALLKSFLMDVYTNLAMVNYPYEASFLAPLPANPIHEVCKHLTNESLTGQLLLMALHKAISVYTNYTGKATCLNIEDAAPDLGAAAWNYQACTEMVMPMCSDGVHDIFEPKKWNITEYSNECVQKFATKPQPYLACREYGCKDLSAATNIVFSNGLLDPWSSGGVLRNLSSSATAIIIPEGAHHIDLRSSNKKDPYSVIQARNYHRFMIKKWIKEYHQKKFRNIITD